MWITALNFRLLDAQISLVELLNLAPQVNSVHSGNIVRMVRIDKIVEQNSIFYTLVNQRLGVFPENHIIL